MKTESFEALEKQGLSFLKRYEAIGEQNDKTFKEDRSSPT